MAIGFVVGLITLRTRGPTFIISTIALVLLTKILLDNWDYIGGTNGISLPLLDLPVELVKLPFYYLMLLLAVGATYALLPHPPLEIRPGAARHLAGRGEGGGRRRPDAALQDARLRALRPLHRHGRRALGLLPDLSQPGDLPRRSWSARNSC